MIKLGTNLPATFLRLISIAGAGMLCFVSGAFVMQSDLSMTIVVKEFLEDAFEGARAFLERGKNAPAALTQVKNGIIVDLADKNMRRFYAVYDLARRACRTH